MNVRQPERTPLSFIVEGLDRFLVWLSIAVGAILTINMIVAVFFRYVLNFPIFWADELSLYLFVWTTFLGAALAVKRSDMAAVTFLLNRLPKRTRLFVLVVIQASILFFAAVIGYYSFLWVTSPSVMNMISPALSVKMWKLYLILPVSMLCIAVFAADHIIRLLRDGIRGGKEESAS